MNLRRKLIGPERAVNGSLNLDPVFFKPAVERGATQPERFGDLADVAGVTRVEIGLTVNGDARITREGKGKQAGIDIGGFGEGLHRRLSNLERKR